ncbi:hypothetical protein QBC34DRAFT_410753 [Podospora aff. communis PSN243]|uniref:Uncharacterized protein n=1 Tax=Podospora aff. communis PSN243 TaxID=3040156 RepID=A0AAV9GGI3_9PEZI|nr:hypothetical protein QBC34DRAFT_410753 [Podospora aff. communis PSN243]
MMSLTVAQYLHRASIIIVPYASFKSNHICVSTLLLLRQRDRERWRCDVTKPGWVGFRFGWLGVVTVWGVCVLLSARRMPINLPHSNYSMHACLRVLGCCLNVTVKSRLNIVE